MTIALSSDTLSTAQIYDAADTILAQRLSQAEGVSQVQVNGAEKPAVRVRLDPQRLAAAGVSAQDVYTADPRHQRAANRPAASKAPIAPRAIGVNGQTLAGRRIRAAGHQGRQRRRIAAIRRRHRHRRHRQYPARRLERQDPLHPAQRSARKPAPTSSTPPTASARCCRN